MARSIISVSFEPETLERIYENGITNVSAWLEEVAKDALQDDNWKKKKLLKKAQEALAELKRDYDMDLVIRQEENKNTEEEQCGTITKRK